MSRWAGRVALVTGAASGIGRALSRALVARGATVVAADLDRDGAEALAAELGPACSAVLLDVADGEAFARCVQSLLAERGRLDYLFNNAGVGLAGAAEALSLADWRRVVEVDLLGVMHGVAAAYPYMVRRGAGCIVNTASGAGLAPRPGMSAYAAAKHGVIGLSTSLRAEAALHGVQVNTFCPGYVATEMMRRSRYVGLDAAGLEADIPIAPMSAEDCARAALAGVEADRAIIPVSLYVRLDWWLFRLSPQLSTRVARWRARRFQARRLPPAQGTGGAERG